MTRRTTHRKLNRLILERSQLNPDAKKRGTQCGFCVRVRRIIKRLFIPNTKGNSMNDQEALKQIRDIADAQLSGGTAPTPPASAVPVMVKPATSGDLGTGDTSGQVQSSVSPGVPVGLTLTIVAGAKNERRIKWEGHPGQFWSRNSWAIFDSAGNRALFADDQVVVGTLGSEVGTDVLRLLGAGTYTFGLAVNGSGRLAHFFVQN